MLSKGLKFVAINIRSLYPSIDEVKCKFKEFDVIGICETWLNNSYDDNLISIENYNLYRQDREVGNILNQSNRLKKGGGLVIYIGSKFRNHSTQITSCCKVSNNLEQLWVLFDKPNVRKTAICMLYRPPNGDVETAISELSNSVDYIQSLCDVELLIMGDMNVNYRERHNVAFEMLKEFERVYNLVQLIKDPTRVTIRSKTTIDLIWTNIGHVSESGVLETILSDHLPVYIIKKKCRESKEFSYITGRSYKNYVKESFQYDINSHVKWKNFWECESDPEKLWAIMEEIISDCANYHCPIVRMKIRENSPAWFSREIVEELYLKDDRYNQARSSGKELDWDIFRNQNRRVKKLILEAKEEYIKELLETNNGNPKFFWRNINEISGLGKNKKRKGVEKIIDDSGKEFRNLEAAEYMNKYYTEAGKHLSCGNTSVWDQTNYMSKAKSVFQFDFISQVWVKNLVKDIKISKSSAVENLGSRILKDAFSVLSLELTYLYNTCIDSCIFPLAWSIGKISPIPKANSSSTQVKDWRPITQIPLPGKLLERVLHDQIYKYFDEKKLFYKNQYGFRKERSTSNAIFDVLKVLYQNWNDKMYTECIFVDFSKAFETIDHNILTEKLKLYGFDNQSLKLMTHYIKTRTQLTTVNGYTSGSRSVECGTAQGSIVGPLIYIIYVNDVLDILESENDIYLYADDMLIVSKDENVEHMMLSLQAKMDKIYKWCIFNRLIINEKKTKYMIVTPEKSEIVSKISIGTQSIGKVKQYEYLGMILDERLTMDKQIENIYKKANKKLGIMSRIRYFITDITACRIYKTMIRPHLEYVDFIIESGRKNLVNKLDRFQERALRKIEYCTLPERKKSYVELGIKYDIEDLSVRRKRSLLSQMYGQSKCEINLATKSCDRILRSDKKTTMKYKFSHLTKLHNSPYYRGVKLWNSLPAEIQKCGDKGEFKKRVKYIIKQ